MAHQRDPTSPAASQITTASNRITVLTDGLIRLESSSDGTFEDQASTFATFRALDTPSYKLIKKDNGALEIATARFHLVWDGKPFSPSGLSVLLRCEGDSQHSSTWRYGQKMSNLGGTIRTLDEVDGRCDLGSGIISQYGFSVLDDSESMLFTEDGWVAPRVEGRTDVYLFAYGLDYRAALKAFHIVSGKIPLIPRWALGNWWSRYYAYTATEYLNLMDRFRADEIPLSVGVIDMDWHNVKIPGDFGTGWTGYSWNEDLFPDPVDFMKSLRDRHLKVTLNLHPADGVRSFEKVYPEMCAALGRDPSEKLPIAFDCTNREFFDAYFNVLHRSLEDQGVDFWWIDWQQGGHSRIPGIDPMWMLNHFHYLDSGRRWDRQFTFSRYAGPGSHRYPIGFSGDTVISWDSLAFQPEFTATASNVGYGWWSNDIGGHYHGVKDDELMARWVQLGLFSPILRLHCSESPFNTREPWAFGPESRGVITKALQFRHRLIPYLYSSAVRASTEGKNLVEPMYYDYPGVAEAYKFKIQYNYGSELMVVPIVSPRDKATVMGKTEGWLPPGRWVDIFTETVYDGDRVVVLHRRLEEYPVLAKEGSIIPLDIETGEGLKNGCPIPTGIEIWIAVGADGKFELVEDDGKGATIEDVVFAKTIIHFDQSSGKITIGPTENPVLKERTWSIRLLSHTPTSDIHLTVDSSSSTTLSVDKGIINLGTHPSTSQLTLSLGSNPQLDRKDVKQPIFELLSRAQMETDVKLSLWKAVEGVGEIPVGRLLSRLTAVKGEREVQEAIEELLLADLR